MIRRAIVVLAVTLLAAPGCRLANPEHWSFPLSSGVLQMSPSGELGAEAALYVWALLIDILIFPVTGIRDLVYILTRPPAPHRRRGTYPPERRRSYR